MPPVTLATNSDILDDRRIERAGEFLPVTPETVDANANPANATVEYKIPQTGEILVTGDFIPTPAAPYVAKVDHHAERAAEAVRTAVEVELGYFTEVERAGAIKGFRIAFVNSPENQI